MTGSLNLRVNRSIGNTVADKVDDVEDEVQEILRKNKCDGCGWEV